MKVGDIVIYEGNNFQQRFGQKAIIISLNENYLPRFIWKIKFEDGLEHMCSEDFLIFVSSNKYKKIKNVNIDPFEEEDWGYIQNDL